MDLYEKAGDTFFSGSRNRDRAVEFYRVLIPPSISVPVFSRGDGHGELCPRTGCSTAWPGWRDRGWRGMSWFCKPASLQTSLQGEAWSTDIFCNVCSSPQRLFGRWEQSPYITNPGRVRCEPVAPGDMLRVRISGT